MGDSDYKPLGQGGDDGSYQVPPLLTIPGFGPLGVTPYFEGLPQSMPDSDKPSGYDHMAPWLGPDANDPDPEHWWEKWGPQPAPLLGPPPLLMQPSQAPPLGPVGSAPPPQLGTDFPATSPSSGPPQPLPGVPDLDYTLPMPPHPDATTGPKPPTIETDPSIPSPFFMPFFPGGD
jgi:hypothetical protein